MSNKENKGGFLSNSQIEEDNKVKDKQPSAYEGAQDTGDKAVRQMGNEVQQRNGLPEKDEEKD